MPVRLASVTSLSLAVAVGSGVPGAAAAGLPWARAVHGEPPATSTPEEGEGAAETDAEAEDADPALEEAERVYREGLAHYETADYPRAIEAWTKAYGLLSNTRAHLRVRLLLLYNLATAHERAFEIDHDVQHLRKARVLLDSFRTSIPTLYDLDDPSDRARAEQERKKVETRIAEIDARIAEVKAEADAERTQPFAPPPAPAAKPAVPMFASGGVVMGLGLAGLGVMTGGLVMGKQANDLSDLDPEDVEGRRAQFDRGRAGNLMAIVGGAVGGVATVVGASLLAVGGARRAAERRTGSKAAAVRLEPLWARKGAGVRLTVRY
ncbi:MAG: hypothetical protein D6705_12210 [Deltaproteobacteria bacterium]|nr:MAG: hypothetical protein D6705_12210 [Deltaproteobacteria bacterium]